MTARGSLWAVGVGIKAPSQATIEAVGEIKRADKVFSLLADPVSEYWIYTLNPSVESLGSLYAVGKERRETYSDMVELIVDTVKTDKRVCCVAYGHPGVFAYPLHESIRRLRADGYTAQMLAGVSAEDCLFAEVGFDPAAAGCRSFEATDFLIRGRQLDPTTDLVLWQVGVIGEAGYKQDYRAWNREGLAILAERLLEAYGPDHEVVLFEAARLPLCESTVLRVPLAGLADADVGAMSTLYVPASTKPKLDREMMRRLGLMAPAQPVAPIES
jgi:uncharacterized protein YabN with tetrapyrrole methylase and pyrophosphatase domain